MLTTDLSSSRMAIEVSQNEIMPRMRTSKWKRSSKDLSKKRQEASKDTGCVLVVG